MPPEEKYGSKQSRTHESALNSEGGREACTHRPCRALGDVSKLTGTAERNLGLDSSARRDGNDGDKRRKTIFYQNYLVTAREGFPGPHRPR